MKLAYNIISDTPNYFAKNINHNKRDKIYVYINICLQLSTYDLFQFSFFIFGEVVDTTDVFVSPYVIYYV